MITQTSWAGLSVQEFFSSYPWQGQLPKLEQTELPDNSLEPSSWLCLSVREFLSQSNWQGQPQVKRSSNQAPILLSLTMSVNQFFKFAAWEGTPEIAAMPSPKSSPEPMPSSYQELKLTDLSDLF